MAFIGTSFVKRGKVGNAKAKDTVRYIQHRTGKDGERMWRPLFTQDSPMSRQEAYQFIDEAPKGTKFFTIIISPDPVGEDTHKDLDMRDITRTTMQTIAQIMRSQGITTPINWVAAVHDGVGPAFVQKITGVGESVAGNHPVRSFRTHHQSDRVFRMRF